LQVNWPRLRLKKSQAAPGASLRTRAADARDSCELDPCELSSATEAAAETTLGAHLCGWVDKRGPNHRPEKRRRGEVSLQGSRSGRRAAARIGSRSIAARGVWTWEWIL